MLFDIDINTEQNLVKNIGIIGNKTLSEEEDVKAITQLSEAALISCLVKQKIRKKGKEIPKQITKILQRIQSQRRKLENKIKIKKYDYYEIYIKLKYN